MPDQKKSPGQPPVSAPGRQQIQLPTQFFVRHGENAEAYVEKPSRKPPEPPRMRTPTVFLKGVDINAATQEQLTGEFRYIGDQLAYQIVHEREKNGPYLDVYDLERVPGLGPKTFERLTDLPWREGGAADHQEVVKVLGFAPGEKISADAVAERFSKLPGFEGCIIAHEDGYILASRWEHEAAAELGVFAPQFSKKLHPYIEQLKLGPMDSLTLFVGERPITLVKYLDLVLAAVHEKNRFNRRHVRIAQQVVRKLRHLMLGDYAAKLHDEL